MTTAMAACNDTFFGPVSTCRFFDFTLTFQNFLLILPSTLLVVAIIVETPRIAFKQTLIQQRKSLFRTRALRQLDEIGIIRAILALLHAIIASALLSLVTTNGTLESILEPSTILPGLSLLMLSAVITVPFTLLARLKLRNGSLIIPLYLFAGIMIDACRIRTYLGIPMLQASPYTHLNIVLLICKFLMLVAENTSGIQTMQSTSEGSASFISKMLFLWLTDVIWTGFRRPLQMVNLDNLASDFEGRLLGARIWKIWKQEAQRSTKKKGSFVQAIKSIFRLSKAPTQINEPRVESIEMNILNDLPNQEEEEANVNSFPNVKGPNLLWVCFKAFPSALLAPVLPKICMSGISLALPFLVRDTLAFAESHAEPNIAQPTSYGWGLVGAYGIVYLVTAFSTGSFYWACDKSQVKLRGALLDMIYRKSLRMHLSAARTTGGGAAANLMAVDLERFVRAIIPFHSLWSGLLVVCVSTYLLYIQLGWTFIATLVSIIICLTFPPIASRGIGGRQARWSKSTDKRVNLTSSAIQNAKGVKFMAYENIIIDKLLEARDEELVNGWSYYRQLLVVSGFTNVVTEIMAVSTFSTLAIVDYISGSQRLTVNLVVTSLTLMQLLESPLLQMGQNYSSIIAALVSLRRIEDFMVKEERPANVIAQSARTSRAESIGVISDFEGKGHRSNSISDGNLNGNIAASFQSASIGWSSSKPVLVNVTLDIPFGQLTMVCGTLASGKSTLLQALLGETNITSGTVYLPMKRTPIAYVAQDGWLQEGATIRENIIFDSPFDAERYQVVIKAAALHVDLEELPLKDNSLAKSLSGGQRQRLTLARALYADAQTYILDDFTSALDAETATHVWNSLVNRNSGLLRGKTVIMATNALQLLNDASLIIRLAEGKVVEVGSFQDLSNKGKAAVKRSSIEIERPEVQAGNIKVAAKSDAIKDEVEDDKHEEVEQGSVKWNVYSRWFNAIGYHFFALCLSCTFIHAGAVLGWNTYLQYWARANVNDPKHEHTLQWLGGFIGLILLSITAFGIDFSTLCWAALVRAGKKLHKAELTGVFGTSLSFFEDNASGRIINRFSQDLFVLDWEIILALGNFLGNTVGLFGGLILLVVPVPYLLVVIFIATLLYVGLQRLYAPTSRQLRRLEMATKSPIYTLFSETSTPAGLATIRGLDRSELFIEMNIGRLNRSQQPYFYLQAVRRWLQTWLNVLSLIINVSLVAVVVILRNTKSIGVLGAGLVQATQMGDNLNRSLVAYTELEIASVALERIFNFASLPREQSDAVNGKMRVKVESQKIQGEIEFRNTSIAYKPGLKPSLLNLNLTIKAGEKLGICGRSGSGKSTLLLAIFAMLETCKGDIYIDGQAISSMSAVTLRNSLTIVPQNALILTATVRVNLDPGEEMADSQLWQALETCKLLQVVQNFPKGLDTMLANDINLSSGQRQLFSLARALLRNRKVLVLDEATSNMDYDTDAAVQHVLRTQFNHCTIITVAHRIATVRDYDRILVLSAGQMVELDTPDNLMKQPAGIFRSLALEQGVE